MDVQGGCYCRAIRYHATGEPVLKGQCHCRECQYISGGHPNIILAMPESGFAYTKGSPKVFKRDDIENAVTREFCGTCGTHIVSKAPVLPGVAIIKVGTLDDPSVFGTPQVAVYTVDKQNFHHLPDGIVAFERLPG